MDDLEAVESDIANPSCSTRTEDCRINCTNSKSLRNIFDITIKHISDFPDSSYFNNQKSEFLAKFSDVFKNALQENVIVNGLPWVVDKDNLSSPEKEDHKQMVDDAVLAQLSKTVSNVAHKRKRCPEQCCRILNMKMKHELQNLKKAKVPDSSSSSAVSPSKIPNKDRRHIKRFSEFCKVINSVKETVQQELTEREKTLKEINFAYNIQTRQRTALKTIAVDDTVVFKLS